MTSIAHLIVDAIDQGYDVNIRVRPRDDGKPGVVSMPNDWARRLGLSDAEMEKMRLAAK